MSEEKISFNSIMRNPHFVQMCCFFHVPMTEYRWSARHPHIPAKLLVKQMCHIAFTKNAPGRLSFEEKKNFLGYFADFAMQVVMDDLRLTYTDKDMEWLVEVLDGDYARVTLAMLFASASAKETYLAPKDIAKYMNQSEVYWRRKAENHEIPGVIYKSRVWLIPLSGLRAIGIDYKPSEEDEQHAMEDETEDEEGVLPDDNEAGAL